MSKRAPASGVEGLDGYAPVTRDDVTDHALLPRRFDMFAAEMRTAFEMLGDKILPFMAKVEATIVEVIGRVSVLERRQDKTDDRLAVLEKQFKARRRARKAVKK